MTVTRDQIISELRHVRLPDGRDVMTADMLRGLQIEGGAVRFILEAETVEPQEANQLRAVAVERLEALDGVTHVQVAVTAAVPPSSPSSRRASSEPPSLKIGRHATPQRKPEPIAGVKHIVAIGSGKGGVGKSTLTANLAVSLAREGLKIGLLDADIHGPSQPKMLGTSQRPSSKDGKIITPVQAHGVTAMSLGMMLPPDEAVIWRGPMLMGALQQMLTQVAWGELDLLLVDLPPGTGDVQLSLAQKTCLDGAVVISTPQDVALLDARKALAMFKKLGTPVLGLVENMSHYICPSCGHEAHLFGHGGTQEEAMAQGLPFLGAIPLELEIRLSGDSGQPVALTKSASAMAFHALAQELRKALSL